MSIYELFQVEPRVGHSFDIVVGDSDFTCNVGYSLGKQMWLPQDVSADLQIYRVGLGLFT
jgi:hypothetical protein